MAKIMDTDNPLQDDEPTAELPILSDLDMEESSANVLDLEQGARHDARRATAVIDGDQVSSSDHGSLSGRLKKAVQEYVEQGEALRAVAKELANQSAALEQTQDTLTRAEAKLAARDRDLDENNEALEAAKSHAESLESNIEELRKQTELLEADLEKTRADVSSTEESRVHAATQLEDARSKIAELEST